MDFHVLSALHEDITRFSDKCVCITLGNHITKGTSPFKCVSKKNGGSILLLGNVKWRILTLQKNVCHIFKISGGETLLQAHVLINTITFEVFLPF